MISGWAVYSLPVHTYLSMILLFGWWCQWTRTNGKISIINWSSLIYFVVFVGKTYQNNNNDDDGMMTLDGIEKR